MRSRSPATSCSPPARATRTRRTAASRTSPSTCSSRAPSGARPRATSTSIVDGIGGEFNAFTSKEYTGYYIRCAGEQRDTALDVLVDMIRNSKFDAEELEREKGVILEEMNMYFDTPRDYVSSVYDELLFGDNPLGWETLGTRETIKAATRETFIDYLDAAGTRRRAWSSASRA